MTPSEAIPPSIVRWYAYKAPYSKKGVLGNPEVPHRGSLLRFCDSDSAALEQAYSCSADTLERQWWAEEANGPAATGAASTAAALDEAGPRWADFMASDAGEAVGIPVRSGTYEADLASRIMRPCYWPAPRHRLLRGTWFAEKAAGEWVPLREALAEQLEQAWASEIWDPKKGRLAQQDDGSVAARLELNTAVDPKDIYALFASPLEAWLARDSSFAWLKHLGATSAAAPTRMRLRRGYAIPPTKAALDKEADLRQEEVDNAAAGAPVSHLLLVVHGIGQTLSNANIAGDALAMRSALRHVEKDAATLAGSGLPGGGGAAAADMSGPGGGAPWGGKMPPAGRVEVLPVQWRKTLNLEVDGMAAQLMPPGLASLRAVLHSTAVEVLLYLTPLHRAEVLGSLACSLNSVYAKFMLRNPGFSGPVSILAHSLGSVLCWDILCNQPPPGLSPRQQSPMACPSWGEGGMGGGGRASIATTLVGSPSAPRHRREEGGGGASELAALRAENERLALEVAALRSEQRAGAEGSPFKPPAGSLHPGMPGGTAVSIPPLHFLVDQLILFGSPLGCFLALRGVNQSRGRGLGTPASAPLMQCDPSVPAMPDGLPAARRLYNVYHPYDPVAYRLEPLAYAPSEVPRAAFVPVFGSGKRLHIVAQEFGEDVGSAASRIGSTLAGALSFKRSKPPPPSPPLGTPRAPLAAEPAAEAVAAEEGGAPTLDEPMPDAGAAAVKAGAPLTFGESSAGIGGGAEATGGTGRDWAGGGSAESGSVWRAAGGQLRSGSSRTSSAGRLDFSLQEATLESQYLAALGAHFLYWSSLDVALLVHRAVRGLDVLTGDAAVAGSGLAAAMPPSSPVKPPVKSPLPAGAFA